MDLIDETFEPVKSNKRCKNDIKDIEEVVQVGGTHACLRNWKSRIFEKVIREST
jgi:hypothetical protein